MFQATKKTVTITVHCDDGVIEIKSPKSSLAYAKANEVIAANEKALLLGYLLDHPQGLTEVELRNYFERRGWTIV
jgi:hypothetical protein